MFPYSTGTVQYWKISAIHGHRRRSASRMFQGSGASMDWSWCFGHAASSGRWQRAHKPAVVWSIAARQILRGGAEFILLSSAAFKLQIWLDAIGCTPVAKWTLLGTGGMNAVPLRAQLVAASKAVSGPEHCIGAMDWRMEHHAFPMFLFDSRTPQGITHIHRTALMRCVWCAAQSEHMVSLRACRDIVACIIHSALSMRSRL